MRHHGVCVEVCDDSGCRRPPLIGCFFCVQRERQAFRDRRGRGTWRTRKMKTSPAAEVVGVSVSQQLQSS